MIASLSLVFAIICAAAVTVKIKPALRWLLWELKEIITLINRRKPCKSEMDNIIKERITKLKENDGKQNLGRRRIKIAAITDLKHLTKMVYAMPPGECKGQSNYYPLTIKNKTPQKDSNREKI